VTSHWRRAAAQIITRVLEEHASKPDVEVRAALRAAYPFGQRQHHPYRIWLDEIRIQTGRRKIGLRARRLQGRQPLPADDRQISLLPEAP
jgi:hypothetical protein